MTNEGSRYYSKSPEETLSLGRQIGSILQVNDVLALSGDLGAGKTTLIQGIAAGCGVKDYVTSPTFILINEYQGRWPFYHVDLYRLDNLAQIEELGIEEYFSNGGVCVIEWAEKLDTLRPTAAHTIEIRRLGENERELVLSQPLAARFAILKT